MLYKNLNNQQNWKDGLTALETIPGLPTYNSNQAWEKLQSRLEENPAKKNNYIYWIAAAVFLGALITLPWIYSGNKPKLDIAIKEPVHIKQQTMPVSKDIKQEQIKIIPQHPAEKLISVKMPIVTTNENTAVIKSKTLQNSTAKEMQIANSDSTSIKQEDLTVIAMPEKMQVVHINELEAPTIQSAIHNHSSSNFRRFVLNNNNSFNNGSPIQNKLPGDHILIKHINSPNQD